jgi:hypothetical protein
MDQKSTSDGGKTLLLGFSAKHAHLASFNRYVDALILDRGDHFFHAVIVFTLFAEFGWF